MKDNIKQSIRTEKITQIYYEKQNGSSYESIVPVTSPDNSTVVGAIYVRASMESVYTGINSIILIFLTASLVAGLLGATIAIFISRQLLDLLMK